MYAEYPMLPELSSANGSLWKDCKATSTSLRIGT